MENTVYRKGIGHNYGVLAHKRGLKCDPIKDDIFYEEVLKDVKDREDITSYCMDWRKGWKHRQDNTEAYEKTNG